jgi:uncharacterized protein YaaW (UPF0174 family)
MTHHVVEPFGTLTLPTSNVKDLVKIKLNTESLTTLLRSNLSCHVNKPLTQELIDTLTQQIVESIDFFVNKLDEIS